MVAKRIGKAVKQTALQKFHIGLSMVCNFAGSPLVRLVASKKGKVLTLSSVGDVGNPGVYRVSYSLEVDSTVELADFDIGAFTVEAKLLLQAIFGRRKIVKPNEKVKLKTLTPEEQALEIKFGRSKVVIPLHLASAEDDLTKQSEADQALSLSVVSMLSQVLKKSHLSLADTPHLGLNPVLSAKGAPTSEVDVVLYGPYACVITRLSFKDKKAAGVVCAAFTSIPSGIMQAFLALSAMGEAVTSVVFPADATGVCLVSSTNCIVALKREPPDMSLTTEDISGVSQIGFDAVSEAGRCGVKPQALQDSLDQVEAFVDVAQPVPVLGMKVAEDNVVLTASLNGGTRSTLKIKAKTNGKSWPKGINVPLRPLRKTMQVMTEPTGLIYLGASETAFFLGWKADKAPNVKSSSPVVRGSLICLRTTA